LLQEDKREGGDLIQHSTKRIKKKIIDYILNNYKTLFFQESERTLSNEEMLSNSKLLKKVEEELRLCIESDKRPRDLLAECLTELEEKGFLN